MTNAHVVAGTDETSVEVVNSRGRTREMSAAVISYDPSTDLAVLYVRGLQAPALQFAPETAAIGDDAIVLGYPLDGPFTPTSAKIRDRIQLRGPNIYDSGEVTREVYTVRAVVRSGNSGGPIIRPDGKVDRRGVRRGAGRLRDRLRADRRPGEADAGAGADADPAGRHGLLRGLTARTQEPHRSHQETGPAQVVTCAARRPCASVRSALVHLARGHRSCSSTHSTFAGRGASAV